jgi:hypothetical protein
MVDLLDLQLGDWVKCKYIYAQVEQVDFDGVILGGVYDGQQFSYDEIDPIYLDDQFLKDMDFDYKQGTMFTGWEGYGLRIHDDRTIHLNTKYSMKCEYVHQLQHLFKLIGVPAKIDFSNISRKQLKLNNLLEHVDKGDLSLEEALKNALDWREIDDD